MMIFFFGLFVFGIQALSNYEGDRVYRISEEALKVIQKKTSIPTDEQIWHEDIHENTMLVFVRLY